ncbi:MAG: OmpA family protein [Saprospiraceae bacterium]|nr:OmpA family protein [Saprospiraceae bacterium]MCB9356731.1 OmpA family protein [Lewinellaceae bacterium]
MWHKRILLPLALILPLAVSAQRLKQTYQYNEVTGYVVDKVSGAPLSQALVIVYDDMMIIPLAATETDAEGVFSVQVPKVERYKVISDKATFFQQEVVVAKDKLDKKVRMKLERKPGYVFDITIFDKAFEHNTINTLRDCKVEIYNNTTQEQVLTIDKLGKSTFNFSFAEGNHYTMLVRKPGYLNRRVEVYVNVNGCILCVDGMGVQEPDVVPLMSHGNEVGYFLGAIDLDSLAIGKRFQLKNIYYDFNKWDIRPEAAKNLNKLAEFLKDNPGLKFELGSHTDSRGSDSYNLTLSEKRAKSAVDYMVSHCGVASESIASKGYGETQLMNKCDDGIACSEYEHQLNRRTEVKITGWNDKDPLWDRSLKEIIEDRDLYKKVIEQERRQKARNKSLTSRK